MNAVSRSLRFVAILIVFAASTASALAQEKRAAYPSLLTLDRLFASNEFDAEGGPSLRWRAKEGYVTLEPAAGGQQLVAHDPATGKRDVLVPSHWFVPAGETRPLAIDGYEFSADESKLLIYTNSKRVWRTNSRGDYWLLDLTNRNLRKLGGDNPPFTTMFATFSPDGTRVCYVHKNNLYVQNLRDLRITALTKDGSDTLINGTFDWVYEEELGLRNGFRWSPDSKQIAYWQLDTKGVKEHRITDSSDGPYPRVISIRYPKTGEQNSAVSIHAVNADGSNPRKIYAPDEPRDNYIAKMDWIDQYSLAAQVFNRLQNTNDVIEINRPNAVFTETDRAWVENDNDFRWIDDGEKLVWLSERDGWRHVYLVPWDREKSPLQITKGAFDVMHIDAIDEKGGWLYFTASPDNPTQRYLYRVSLKGGKAERVTPTEFAGTNGYSIAPDARWAVHTHSRFGVPPVVTLVHLPDHKVVKTFADNAALRKKLAALQKCATEFFRVDIGNDVQLDGWCIKPPGFDPAKKYPVLFYVYGEPAGQTVLDRWDGRRFLWHSMLAQQGYLIMSVDNRGTPAPRGRDWRRSIYRQVGILASADQAAATRALLKERPYMDPNRIAIWGWSGGGSMSLNAIFRYPDLYQTAMAIAPVPNQRHYDTIYQERYMGLPADNVEGYRKGSPIHFAKNLKGNLLIVHGTGDDNCHYLGVENLIDELVAHNKHFTMLAYPNRSHGIFEGKGTTRHLYESLTRYLRANTPANK